MDVEREFGRLLDQLVAARGADLTGAAGSRVVQHAQRCGAGPALNRNLAAAIFTEAVP